MPARLGGKEDRGEEEEGGGREGGRAEGFKEEGEWRRREGEWESKVERRGLISSLFCLH